MRQRSARHRLTSVETLIALALLVSAHGQPAEGSPPRPAPSVASSKLEATFDYLYLNSNEDQASGGHAAVRMEDDVYHFQYDDGLLRLEQDDWSDFQLSYRGLQNRSIHQTRIAISLDTLERLRETFARRHLTQSAQIERLRDARSDHRLVVTLTSESAPSLALPGLGFFAAPVAGAHPVRSARLSRLRSAIETRYGSDFLPAQLLRHEAKLATLEVHPFAPLAADFAPGVLPRPRYAFHDQYTDLLAAIRALHTLRADVPVATEVVLSAESSAQLELQPWERRALNAAVTSLEDRLVALVESTRPDWGHAMLLGMARLESMDASLRAGHWVLLDALAGATTRVELGQNTRKLLPGLEAEAREQWRSALAEWRRTPGWNEQTYGRLERAASRWSELRSALAGARHLRIRRDPGVPRGMGRSDAPLRPHALSIDRNRHLHETAEVARIIESYARDALGYQLVTRNCVSELFSTIDQAMAKAARDRGPKPDAASLAHEFELRLGGSVDPSPIPFVSSLRVRRNWRVQSTKVLPSWRRQQAAALYAADPTPWVQLRESNTLTSTLYHPSDRDSYFVFFTDGASALRPLQGFVNLMAGFGRAGAGLLELPFDQGRGLSAGLRGALFSFPELAFFNIRKGTNDWIPTDVRPDFRDHVASPVRAALVHE